MSTKKAVSEKLVVSDIEDVSRTALVKVWELPVRIIHWTIFTSVVMLSLTGFYIGNPFVDVESEAGFFMGWVKAQHALFAWIFIAAIIARIIWMFTGNRWARWDQFIPTTAYRRRGIRGSLRYYLFLRREPPRVVGHNPLAGMTYTILFLMFAVQIFTGLALKSLDAPGTYLSTIAGWVFDVAPIAVVRSFHHIIMWLTWGFVVHHFYSAILIDWEEKNGILSSIVTGWKRVPTDRL